MNKRWLGFFAMSTGVALVGLQACGDDEVLRATPDASTDTAPVPVPADTGPPDMKDGGVDSGVQTFTVPSGGGSIDVQGQSMKITFAFPASAAGKAITIALGAAADTGFPAGTFSDVIKLGPSGERFADPILVKPEKPNRVGSVLTFAQSGMKGPASAALYNASTGSYEMRHFTALVIAPPGKTCDSEGATDSPDSGRCPADASTFRQLTCKGFSYCVVSSGSCCIDPAVDSGPGCLVEQQVYSVSHQPYGSNGGQNPWCDGDAGDWDGGDAGCAGGLGLTWTANGGCVAGRSCASNYDMSCNGTTCTCTKGGNVVTGTFAQGTTCDDSVTIRTSYVQGCNYPAQ